MVVIAQLAEHRIVVPSVVGSSPTIHPKKEQDTFWYVALFLTSLLYLIIPILRVTIFLFGALLRFHLCFYFLPCLFGIGSDGGVNDGLFSQFGLDELELLV